jgi:hypothetical protein
VTPPTDNPIQDVSALTEALKLLVAPLLAAFLGGYLVSRWKTREDTIEKRSDEICQEIRSISENASVYWQKEPTDGALKILAETITAGIVRVDGLRSAIAPHVSSPANDEMAKAASFFLRETTGGQFGVHNRASDLERARSVIQQAALFSVAVRQSRMRDLKGWRRRRH